MKTENKGLAVFFAIAFGLPVLLGIFMGISFYAGKSVDAFPLVWMYLPATAAMAAALVGREEKTDAEGNRIKMPKVFYLTFCEVTALMVILLIVGSLIQGEQAAVWISFLVYGVSLVGLLELLFMKKDKRKAYGLGLVWNVKKSLQGIGLFILLYLLLTGLGVVMALVMGESLSDFSVNPYFVYMLLVVLPLNLLLSFTAFFGEEYGWRYYLQPVLQKKFGKKKGVLLLGILWGLWHVPLTIMGHNYGVGYPGFPFTGIIAMCIFCTVMGTILSFVTIKTGSCIPAIMGHGTLNGFASAGLLFTSLDHPYNVFLGPAPTGLIGGLGFIAVACALLYLLCKEEKEGKEFVI